MSNLPPSQFNSTPGALPVNANPGPQLLNHNQPFRQVPASQLPPGYSGLKQDANSNSPVHLPPSSQNVGQVQAVNNYNQSSSSSPAFNHPGMMPPPPPTGLQSSPLRPPVNPTASPSPNQFQSLPHIPMSSSSSMAKPVNANVSTAYPPNFTPQQRQINDNAPPLVPSSQFNQPIMNGPTVTGPPGSIQSQPPTSYPASSTFNSIAQGNIPTSTTNIGQRPLNPPFGINQGPAVPGLPKPGPPNVPGSTAGPASMPFSGPPLNGPPRNSPLPTPMSGPSVTGVPPQGPGINGRPSYGGPSSLPPVSMPGQVPPLGHPSGPLGPPSGPLGPPSGPLGPPSGPLGPGLNAGASIPSVGPPGTSTLNGPPRPGPIYPGQHINGPTSAPGQHMNNPNIPMVQQRPPPQFSGPQSLPPGPMGPPMGPQSLPPMGDQMGMPPGVPGLPSGPTGGPPKSNMQNRYPQMPATNYNHQGPNSVQQVSRPFGQPPHVQNTQQLTQQMGQLSVTKQGFDQLWGHQMLDLMQCKHILPEYPEDPPEIRLGSQFADAPNCSPDIFRCTINRIPDTNSLLQKSRLPLGILIHPFKDLNHLPVIQCTTIVRCRACRTYINPFVYFVDAKRWKCNLCYRVNDLPEEFQYDPVSKSYGDPSRRPEIKSATIEFIAPAEYMLRPPQPAVYLFLLDVSQIARDSGYLQVLCDTLRSSIEQLPGDARTQVGFICYDAHVHFYLMNDGLARPKEMTVLDIDDMFLPSPESLLVNVGEARAMVCELLAALPARHSAPAPPACALGAALTAAYKLMAPTGGRITVFQTCLPNVGPGALQPREDPNARSSKDVAHLNPATDFYKRLALECSGAQVAVDLFLLAGQYCDLATLSGMSKFSAGSIYHFPLFRAARAWQADHFRRVLTRYLTRKIGFEAVMRVRCTRGISIHTFHGNFFVRSTDLLSLPNVSPDAGFGMQLTIEESLSDLQHVCFQAALLYTSSKGERRIRVHTMALPIATNLTDVLHSADQQCIIGLLSKMAVDRCASASMSEAREALTTVAVDALSAHRLAQNLPAGAAAPGLLAPASLALLPLYLHALLKRKAFRTGTSTRLDDRVADMCDMKTWPLSQLLRAVYPDLYPVHALREHLLRPDEDDDEDAHDVPDPPRLHLTAERINQNGAYLLDDGETLLLYVCHGVSPAFLSEVFGVAAFSQLPDEARALPRSPAPASVLLHAFIDKLNDDRPYASNLLIIKDSSPGRTQFTERLVDDRVESSFAYYEFLQHVKTQVK